MRRQCPQPRILMWGRLTDSPVRAIIASNWGTGAWSMAAHKVFPSFCIAAGLVLCGTAQAQRYDHAAYWHVCGSGASTLNSVYPGHPGYWFWPQLPR